MENWQRVLQSRREARRHSRSGTVTAPSVANAMPSYPTDTRLDWQAFEALAKRYSIKALYQDRQDVTHDIVIRLAELATARPDHQLSQASQCRIASYVILQYWDSLKRLFTTTSLNEEIDDGEGGTVELYQTIADDKAIDLEAWIDHRTWLKGCPRRLLQIAFKTDNHIALTAKDRKYLSRYRQKELAKHQRALF